tara:strand:- start:12 stop:311 length:300 start_codon:yes stop_codon:yes gene_type:complete
MRDLAKHPLTPKEFDAYVEDFKVVDEYKKDYYPRGGYDDEGKHKVPRSYRICSGQAGIESVEMFNEDLHVWSVVVLNTSPDIDISHESWEDHVDMYGEG